MSHDKTLPEMADAAWAPSVTADAASRSSRAARPVWSVAVLSAVALLAGVDQEAFAVLLTPIQKSIHVSDAAMGILTGSALAIVYAVIGLPLSRLVDNGDRRRLLAIAVAVWSVGTAFCGLARGFTQLLLARLLVNSSSAVQLPASLSIVGDLITPRRRGAAISALTVGSALGIAGGSALAGALNDLLSWRAALMIVGAPGLVLAAVLMLTVREPSREAVRGGSIAKLSLAACTRRCLRIRTIYPFALGWVCLHFCFMGWLTWMPAFLMRVHHLSSTKMGVVFGAVIACATIASILAGPLTDFLARRAPRWRLYYCCAAIALSVPVSVASMLAAGLPQTIACLVAYTLLSGGVSSVTTTAYVSFSPVSMRGFVAAAMNLVSVFFGAGAAPVVFGMVNDVLQRSFGDQSLRYTMLLSPAMLLLAGVFFGFSSRTFDADVARASDQ
jgi:predicted MFS family arabinose efflux permease